MLDNDYVIGSAFLARAYAKLILDKDVAGAIQDGVKGLDKLGLKKFAVQAQSGLVAALADLD